MEKDKFYDEIDDDEEFRRRHEARMRRRRLEKERQIRRTRMIKKGAVAAVLVLVVTLSGRGIYKLVSGNDKKAGITTEVKAEPKKEVKASERTAEKQKIEKDDETRQVSKEEKKTASWQTDKKGKWYHNEDHTFYVNGWAEIDGDKYYFNKKGYVTTGWKEFDGKDFFFDEDGVYDSTKQRPMVALTYDDGPGKFTEELLDCLEENNAKATFYMVGKNAKVFPDSIKRMKELGMSLGNHTYDHTILTKVNEETVKEKIGTADDAIEEAAGVPSSTLRPPGGSANDRVKSVVELPIILWSIDTKDWKTRDADQTYDKVMENVTDGSIVLMHDIHESSVQASLRIIPELVEKGFKLVTIEELAEAKGIELENGKSYFFMGEGDQQI